MRVWQSAVGLSGGCRSLVRSSVWLRRTLTSTTGQGSVGQRLSANATQDQYKGVDRERPVENYGGSHRHAPRIYAWGRSDTGSLGIPKLAESSSTERIYPARIKAFDSYHLKVKDLSCGHGHTVMVTDAKDELHLVGFGLNSDSQLGVHQRGKNSGTGSSANVETLDFLTGPRQIQLPYQRTDTRVVSVACGRAHTVVATDKEGVFTLGHNGYGQCGRPIISDEVFRGNFAIHRFDMTKLPYDVERPEAEHVTKVACGLDTTFLLTNYGRLFSCGLNTDGQAGVGSKDNCITEPTLVGGDLKGENIVALSCRADTILAISDKGDLFAWGNGEYQQFAWPQFWGELMSSGEASSPSDSSVLDQPYHLNLSKIIGPIRGCASAGTMCAVIDDGGQVFVWGFGLLGRGPAAEHSQEPLLLPSTLFGRNEINPDARVSQIDCGLNYFAAVVDDGSLYSWGKNLHGQLGLNFKPDQDQYFPLKVPVPAEVSRVACGVNHAVCVGQSWA